MTVDLGPGTLNERRALELLRALKARSGHATLRVEVKDGWESLFESMPREIPPEPRPAKLR